ncbi:hypothetical protein GCM10027516_20910 [Niabella aquatica]
MKQAIEKVGNEQSGITEYLRRKNPDGAHIDIKALDIDKPAKNGIGKICPIVNFD